MTNGMKPGSGSNPFEDDDDEKESVEDQTSIDDTTEEEPVPTETATTVPWLFVRDGVKQSRDHTFQLHLRSETRTQEKRFQTAVEERLGEDVYKADLREAALLVAMENEDEVVDQLREWGYDFDQESV